MKVADCLVFSMAQTGGKLNNVFQVDALTAWPSGRLIEFLNSVLNVPANSPELVELIISLLLTLIYMYFNSLFHLLLF